MAEVNARYLGLRLDALVWCRVADRRAARSRSRRFLHPRFLLSLWLRSSADSLGSIGRQQVTTRSAPTTAQLNLTRITSVRA
jgi:hypothetical protein